MNQRYHQPNTRVTDFLQVLGPNADGLLRGQLVTTRAAELDSVRPLDGEDALAAKERYELEGRMIHRLVWRQMDPATAMAEEPTLTLDQWLTTIDRVDFTSRLEHHVALKAVLASCRGLDETVRLLDSGREATRLSAAKALVQMGGDHELFRSRITAAMQHTTTGPDPRSAFLEEVMQEAGRLHQEARQAVEEAKRQPLPEGQEPPLDAPSHTPEPPGLSLAPSCDGSESTGASGSRTTAHPEAAPTEG